MVPPPLSPPPPPPPGLAASNGSYESAATVAAIAANAKNRYVRENMVYFLLTWLVCDTIKTAVLGADQAPWQPRAAEGSLLLARPQRPFLF